MNTNYEVQMRAQSEQGDTATRLAKQSGVSRATVVRSGQFAAAVDRLKSIAPDIERRIMQGDAPPRSTVVKAARLLDTAPDQAAALLRGDITPADAGFPPKSVTVRADNPKAAANALVRVYGYEGGLRLLEEMISVLTQAET